MREGKLVSREAFQVLEPNHRKALLNGASSQALALDLQKKPKALHGALELDVSNFASLLRECRDARDLPDGKRAHTIIIESGLHCSNPLESLLVHMYGHSGALEDARELLSKMQLRDKFTWNNMIKSYGQHGHGHEALQCFDQMQQEGVMPDMFIYASVLSECTTLGILNKGQQLHSVIASSGITVDVVVGTALVNMYGKFGRLADAHRAFDIMSEHDTASWNAIISSYAQHEQVKDALDSFKQMQQQGVVPNRVTFISILPAFASQETLATGKEIHDLVTIYGFESDVNLGNALINMYGKCGSLDDAQGMFELISEKNTLSWTVMITSFVQNGQSNDAFILFDQMQREGIMPDKVTYINMLSACADQATLAQGQMIHALIMRSVDQSDVELKNALVNMYSKCGSMKAAQRIFDDMLERSVVSWNAMISACVQHGQNQIAIQLFFQMQPCGQVPDKVTFLSVLSACAHESAVFEMGRDLHSALTCYGLDTDVILGNALVHMYGKQGVLEDAWKVFDNLLDRNSISWNVMISEQVQDKGAMHLFVQMLEEGVMPCKGTVVSLLTACGCSELLNFGKETHARMVVSTYGLDVATGNRLIDMYQKCGSVNYAQELFECMPERDSVTWTEMIAGCTSNGQSKAALWLFDQMQQEGLATDRVTYICIFSACASHAALTKGKLIHTCVMGSALEHDIAVGNALINMYGKCGSLKEAHRFFSQMSMLDVVSWSSMIANYAQHGYSKDALQMFHQMRQEKVLPDQITFVSVLCACSHSGQVAEGCYWFEFMKKNLSIKPTLDHYNCMVDLLGRAGMLDQAENMIRDMPFKPNVVSWMTLLGACRYHVDVERGERSARHVFKLDPLDPAPYVMLSNLYSTAGRVEEAARIISWMKEKGLKQGQCYSSIEVGGKVHEFYDDDQSHPQSEEIQVELRTLSRKICEAGDVSNMKLLLHHEEIKHQVLSHSEKLALAFGFVSTPPETPLFIAKNSQVCLDCHSFIKLASKLAAREIIVRDARRFHYMQDGICSCGDYW